VKTRVALSFIILLLLLAPLAWSDDGAFKGKTACLFPLTDVSGTDPLRAKTITDSVALELQAAGFQLMVQDQLTDLGGRPQAAVPLARGFGADVAVTGFFAAVEAGEGAEILVCVSFYDVAADGLMGGFERSWRYNLGFHNLLHAEIADLLTRMKFSKAPPAPVADEPSGGLRMVRFTSSLEGMEVFIAGEVKAGAIKDGKLDFYSSGMKPGAPLIVEKRLDGYQTARQAVKAAETVALEPLQKKTSYAFEVNSTFGQLFGFGGAARFYFVPDGIFGCVSVYPYAQLPIGPGGADVLHTDVALSVGLYLFFPPDFPFRIGISTGLGGIFSAVLSSTPLAYVDLYYNVANAWLELNLDGVSFYLRTETKYALGLGGNALGRGVIQWDFLPPLTLGVLVK
jgi:hypothetical protein